MRRGAAASGRPDQKGGAIEALNNQGGLPVDLMKLGRWHADAGPTGKFDCDGFPCGHIPIIAGDAWELRDRGAAIELDHMGLWSGATERAPTAEEHS